MILSMCINIQMSIRFCKYITVFTGVFVYKSPCEITA